MSTSSGNGDSTLSPTKGSSTDKPLDDDHVEELLARRGDSALRDSPSAVGKMEVFSESEIEVVSQRRVSKRPRASDSISSTYESVSTSLRQTKNRASERAAYLQDLAYRLTGLTKGQKRPLPSHLPTPNELQGHRDFPDGFPTPDLLYATDDRPGALPKVLPVYKFPNCKHSACYVCTFLHLEASWACPECARPMHEAPRRDYGLEEEIHRQYPEWTDGSVVTYAFSRFTFPRRPVAFVSESGSFSGSSHPSVLRRCYVCVVSKDKSAVSSELISASATGVTHFILSSSTLICSESFNAHPANRPCQSPTVEASSVGDLPLVNSLGDLPSPRCCLRSKYKELANPDFAEPESKIRSRSHHGYTGRARTRAESNEAPECTYPLVGGERDTIFIDLENSKRRKHGTDEERHEAHRRSSLKYDHSERGRQVRRERVRSRRKIAKVHIPRLVLPDLVEEWACADLRQTRKVFIAAHRLADEFEEIEFTHWISPPPFDAAAISLADEPPEGNYNDWLASLVDGCLLRREEAFEAGLKEQLELIGQKKMWDRLRTEVKRLLTQDWAVLRGQEALYEQGCTTYGLCNPKPAPPVVFALDITTIKFFFFPTPISLHPSMSTTPRYPTFFTRFFTSPPTRDDPLKRQELKRDSELPRGEIRSFVNAVTDKHWQITLIGRIVAVVQEQEERYLVLEALPGEEMLQDFQEMVWALERLKDRTAQSSHTKCANSWTQPGLDGFDSGFIYVHITSRTQLTTHACERGEPWIVEPPFTPVDPLAVGAAVYCVAYLLQIDNMVHDEPLISSKQWIVKCRFLSRLHLPSAGARAQNPAMLVFLSRGGVPGRPLAASQALPARDETDDAEE
ncbi:hypothetical protein C8F01DRAFT_1081542 [Mycena amicta]|nr:hypothetical protein C8F01DRAFT_1081542 [Mycena amicta]